MHLKTSQFLRIAASLVWLACLMLPTSSATAAQCKRQDPTVVPTWTLGGAWDGEGSLMLLEPITSRVVRYRPDLPSTAVGPSRAEEVLASLGAKAIRPFKDGYLAELPHQVFLRLDSRFRETGRTSVTEVPEISGFFPLYWTSAGESLLVCGDLRPPEGQWTTALFEVPLLHPGSYRTLLDLEKLYPLVLYCQMQFSLLATMGDVPVLLRFSAAHVEILAFPPRSEGPVPLDVIPADFSRPATLPIVSKAQDMPSILRDLQLQPTPYGLYADAESLYLLLRSPSGGGAVWELLRFTLSTEGGSLAARVEGMARIPSRAPHLLVQPGSPNWAFVEKEEAREFGNQPVSSILYVPASQITAIRGEGDVLCQ